MLRKPITQVFIFFGLAVAVGSALYFEDIKQTVSRPVVSNPDQAESYLFNTQIITIDETGQVSQMVETPSTVQSRLTRETQIMLPKISLYQNQQVIWRVSAKNAIVSNDAATMALHDNVVLQRTNDDTRLTSNELHYHVPTRVATSKSSIEVKSNDVQITANGLSFDLSKENYQLQNKVIATYAR